MARKNFNVTTLEPHHVSTTAAFLAGIFGHTTEGYENIFRHWWGGNPAWAPDIPRGWIAISDTQEVVGFTANIPIRYVFNGRVGIRCATGNTSAHPDWRRQGVARAVAERFVSQPTGDLLVGTESSDAAYRLWQSVGLTPLDRPWLRTSYRILADAKGWVRRRFGTGAGHLAGLLQIPAIAAYRSATSLRVQRIYRFEESDSRQIDLCAASTATTYALRNTETLNWCLATRESDPQPPSLLVFEARHVASSEFLGYLAMKRIGEHAYNVVECRTRRSDPDIARALLLGIRSWAQENRVSYIVVRPYVPMLAQALPKLLTIHVKQRPMTYCYKFKNSADQGNWETTSGDGDVLG